MTAATGLRALSFVLAISLAWSDCYMHNPRGSNNRLNERSANRDNANRLFDSQNNNRGGYNVGEVTADFNDIDTESKVYNMRYFQSGPNAPTYLTIEWTNQHGCGGDDDSDSHKLNCNIVIQYMVMDDCDPDMNLDCLRNGVDLKTQVFTKPPDKEGVYQETPDDYATRRNVDSTQQDRGLHESFDFYNDCYMRSRNKGLFTADQNIRTNKYGNSSAVYTRQNSNGNQRGYECPEERDYYPYWHPTPWRDIAILADNASQCSNYIAESFNVKPRGICRETYQNSNQYREWSYWNNQADCEIHGGQWFTGYAYIDVVDAPNKDACLQRNGNGDGLTYTWKPKKIGKASSCLVLPGEPDCQAADWTRVNHLGNGREGVPLNYTWRLPYFPTDTMKRIVVRIRYNISTDDYDPFNTDASQNQNLGAGVFSPVQQNPYVNIGASSNKALRLAINTAQFGRTFQDRSHVLRLLPRTGNDLIGSQLVDPTCTIHNLNVRGKRGNIVQVYPAVEYDFIPNRMTVSSSDCVHIQWTGSNRHNNGNPAGDGQAGDAGEGRSGTDRNNMVEAPNAGGNYPLPWEETKMWNGVELIWKDETWTNASALKDIDIGLAFATSGYYSCYEASTCGAESLQTKAERLNRLLNNASPSFGAVVRFQPGTYHYINSRNNNFTNRSQKGRITVTA